MSKSNITNKKTCSSCLKSIGKYQKWIECNTCHRWYHAKSACVKSFDANVNNAEIDICKLCLDNALPFQSLDDLEYELNITRGRTFSQDDMDRITQLSYNPFQLSINDLELCGISAHPDSSFDIDKIKCDYYLTNEQKRCHHKRQTKKLLFLVTLKYKKCI